MAGNKKTPDRYTYRSGVPGFPTDGMQRTPCLEVRFSFPGRSSDSRLILLPRLPVRHRTVTWLRNSSPVTAAGPSRIHTGFPFQPQGGTWKSMSFLDSLFNRPSCHLSTQYRLSCQAVAAYTVSRAPAWVWHWCGNLNSVNSGDTILFLFHVDQQDCAPGILSYFTAFTNSSTVIPACLIALRRVPTASSLCRGITHPLLSRRMTT